jgi:hypothetical protein
MDQELPPDVAEAQRRLKDENLSALSRNLGVPYRWLRHIRAGAISEPGFEKMTKLREYFLLRDSKARRK